MKKKFILALTCLTLTSATAYAQAIGGGGGPLGGLVNWVEGNVVQSLGIFALICIGGAFIYLRFHAIGFAACAVGGIWLMANAQQIYGAITGGGF